MSIPHLKQGTLDGLCGVYALLNAIFQRIYHDRELSYEHRNEHFETAISCIPKRQLTDAVLNGMTCDSLFSVCRKFCSQYKMQIDNDWYTIKVTRPYKNHKFSTREDFHRKIFKRYITDGSACIIGVSYRDSSLNKSGHWLAVRACVDDGFKVVNNSNKNFIPKHVKGNINRSFERIDYDETILLQRVKM